MKLEEITKGMSVYDPLASLGYGKVVRVCKKTVWVEFYQHHGRKTIYDLEHLQFLQRGD